MSGKEILKQSIESPKREKFTKIFVQEYLLGFRPEEIIKAISLNEEYYTAEQTIRGIIKPAALKAKIKAGHFQMDENYKSMLSHD